MKAPEYTKGPWKEYTSNSFSRIGAAHGHNEIIYGVRMMDGFSTLTFRNPADKPLVIAAPMLAEALNALLEMYLHLANSGDCGFWNPEEEPQVITARAALLSAGYTEE